LATARKKTAAAVEEAKKLLNSVPQYPKAVIEWECKMNPDPYFNSCYMPEETVQPTYSLLRYSNIRNTAPWNYSSLGLCPIDDHSYRSFYKDPAGKWSKFETLTLLELIKEHGAEDSVWKDIITEHHLLRIRHSSVEDCQGRFLTILALAS